MAVILDVCGFLVYSTTICFSNCNSISDLLLMKIRKGGLGRVLSTLSVEDVIITVHSNVLYSMITIPHVWRFYPHNIRSAVFNVDCRATRLAVISTTQLVCSIYCWASKGMWSVHHNVICMWWKIYSPDEGIKLQHRAWPGTFY